MKKTRKSGTISYILLVIAAAAVRRLSAKTKDEVYTNGNNVATYDRTEILYGKEK